MKGHAACGVAFCSRGLSDASQNQDEDQLRKWRTIVAMSFSWNRRMAAMPAAPAFRHDGPFADLLLQGPTLGFLHGRLESELPAGRLGVFFFEHGSEDRKIRLVRGGLGNLLCGVTGDSNEWISWRDFAGRGLP